MTKISFFRVSVFVILSDKVFQSTGARKGLGQILPQDSITDGEGGDGVTGRERKKKRRVYFLIPYFLK